MSNGGSRAGTLLTENQLLGCRAAPATNPKNPSSQQGWLTALQAPCLRGSAIHALESIPKLPLAHASAAQEARQVCSGAAVDGCGSQILGAAHSGAGCQRAAWVYRIMRRHRSAHRSAAGAGAAGATPVPSLCTAAGRPRGCAHLMSCSAVRRSGAPSRCSTASPRASSGSQWRVRWCSPCGGCCPARLVPASPPPPPCPALAAAAATAAALWIAVACWAAPASSNAGCAGSTAGSASVAAVAGSSGGGGGGVGTPAAHC